VLDNEAEIFGSLECLIAMTRINALRFEMLKGGLSGLKVEVLRSVGSRLPQHHQGNIVTTKKRAKTVEQVPARISSIKQFHERFEARCRALVSHSPRQAANWYVYSGQGDRDSAVAWHRALG
jgi:hypothetical protein